MNRLATRYNSPCKPEKISFTLYSFVIDDFVPMEQEERKEMIRRNLAENVYPEAAFDSP